MKPTRFLSLLAPAFLLSTGLTISLGAISTGANRAAAQMYNPIKLNSEEVQDTLSTSDIPTGTGGFARDYTVELKADDQITVDASSDEFDTLVTLLDANGVVVNENDDGPDGSTNSLLFARITEPGKYTIRVRSYAGGSAGPFKLKLTRLRPI